MLRWIADKRTKTTHRSIRFGESGAALVEFAVILPLLVICLFGIIEFGTLLYDKAMLTNASREGAREGIVYVHLVGEDEELNTGDDTFHPTTQQIRDVVKRYAQNHLISFGPDTLQDEDIVVTPNDPENGESGNSLTVTVTYHYSFLLLPGFISALVGGPDLAATTIMRFE
jgi:Flp pilus assembly protein TadG